MSEDKQIINISFDFNDISEIKDKDDFNNQENRFLGLNYSLNDFYICPICNETPLIEFENNNIEKIIQKCSCCSKEQKEKENNIIDMDDTNEFITKDMKCSEHKIIYSFYCETENKNLCKICLNDHNAHTIIEFDKDNLEIKRKIIYIKYILKLNVEGEKSFDQEQIEFNNIDKLKCLVSTIINHYKCYPNYNIIKNINTIYDSLSYYIKNNPKDNDLENALNVNSPTDFYELIKKEDNKSIIKSIIIIGMNFYNIEIFDNIVLKNLTILDLRRNNINDISFLAKAKLQNLEKLDLGMNELHDNMIKYIGDFNFPKLTYLNFYNNYFTDYKIFKAVDITHFCKLKELYVNSNRFNYSITKIDIKNIKLDLSKLEKIFINNGVFSDASSKLLTCFNMSNVKEIFLMANNLANIDFLEKMKMPNLYRLCLDNNKISSVKKLDCLKKNSPNLKIIELKNNCLEDIGEIEELILNWDLDEFNVTGNKINLKSSKAQHIIY